MDIPRTIAKNTFFYFITSATDVISNLVVGIVLARSLGPDTYGTYSFFMWAFGLGALVTNLGLNGMATRFIAEALGQSNIDRAKGLIRLSLSLRFIAALVALVILLILSRFGGNLLGDPASRTYFAILAFALVPNVLNLLLPSIFSGFQRYDYGTYVMLGSSPLRAIILISLAALGFGVGPLLIANVVGWVVGVLIGLFLLRRIIPLKSLLSSAPLSENTKKKVLKYAVTVFAVTVVSYVLWNQAEVLFLGLWCSAKQVGFYRLACQLPVMIMNLVPSVFASVLLPTVSEQFGRGDMEKIKAIYLTSTRYLMIIALPLAVAGIVLARPIANTLWGAGYEPTIVLMQIVFIPFCIYAIAGAGSAVIYALNKPSFDLKVGLALAVLSIGLDLWLIPKYGVLGAAIGSSIPRFFLLPAYAIFASRNIKAAWPMADTLKIAFACSIMGLALFALQTQIGAIPSLVLSIPVGLAIYVSALFALRVVRQQDAQMFVRIQYLLPATLRKMYVSLVDLAMKASK